MQKLLVVCGPTATGKTGLALKLAKKFSGQIVSADSRQVYKEMDIGTGKDLPSKAKKSNPSYYSIAGTKLWGYDLVSPRSKFSVANYIKFARSATEKIRKSGDLPMIVGGTGFYIQGVVDGIETASIPQNKSLRKQLARKNADELFEILAQFNPSRAANLNMSDKKNPRRLIRAIEVASATSTKNFKEWPKQDVLFVGLSTDRKKLNNSIKKRVYKRLKQGFEKEVKKLLNQKVSWNAQSMQSLGYRQWRKYVEGEITKKEAIKDWIVQETRYAKKQMTWFKKDKRINWFDVSKWGYQKKVEKLVATWYMSKD